MGEIQGGELQKTIAYEKPPHGSRFVKNKLQGFHATPWDSSHYRIHRSWDDCIFTYMKRWFFCFFIGKYTIPSHGSMLAMSWLILMAN